MSLAALVAGLVASCAPKASDAVLTGWRKDVGDIRVGVNAGEDNATTMARWSVFRDRLSKVTGLKVKIFESADYNGVIQAMASGQLELAGMGPASYANVYEQIGDKVSPILAPRSAEGYSGYYSTLVVRADSPYRTIDDLAGKTIGYVDFNSMSGYLYPRHVMREQGKDPEKFFGKAVISGGHTQGVLALANGQFDAVFMLASGGTPATGFTTGSIWTLARRGGLKVSDYRIVWTAGPIPNSPYVIRTDRPQPFQDMVRGTLAALAYEDPALWDDLGLLEGSDMLVTSHEAYKTVIDMRRAEIALRRGTSGKASPQ